MQNPWDVRPLASTGDKDASALYLQIGRALSNWEISESAAAQLFDALVAAQPSNGAAFSAFIAVTSSSARTKLLGAACDKALDHKWGAYTLTMEIVSKIQKFGARRNEIAHGIVREIYSLGFYIIPNDTMPFKWKNGVAKYQYNSEDIAYYADCFSELARDIINITPALRTVNPGLPT
jgi:hypothetical protein